ncbi:MAG: DeoR family transcriptional regulator [Methanobrevibacter sp.]|nr:DeoR family transcriptional regulator [Candidatus Methanoflexus mossambicus]
MNNRQISALKIMIESKNAMTVKKYGEHFGVSRSTAKRDLTKLLDLDLISKDKIKGKKETIYVIV